MSKGDEIRGLISETQARYSTAIGDLICYSFEVQRKNNELQAEVERLNALILELDSHKGAEGWSVDLEVNMSNWRLKNGHT